MLRNLNSNSLLLACQSVIRQVPVRFKRRRKPPGTSIYHKIKYEPYRIHQRLVPYSVDERLTESNREFMKGYIRHKYAGAGTRAAGTQAMESPLLEQPWPRGEWDPDTKRTGVLAIKLGMIPQWTKSGRKITVTLLWVKDNHVISYQPWEQWRPNCADFDKWLKPRRQTTREFDKVVVGADGQDPRKFTSSYLGLFKETGLMPKKRITAFYVSRNAMIQPGTPLDVMHFRVGDYVDCHGRTICYGFQGVIKRWGFGGGPSDKYGCTKFHRRPGSLAGNAFSSTISKGKKMPGMMGGVGRGIRGLKIWRINTKYNILYVNGPVPGPVNTWIRVLDSSLPTRRVGCGREAPPPHMPTHYPGDTPAPVPDEYLDPELHDFTDDSITFKEDEDTKKTVALRNR